MALLIAWTMMVEHGYASHYSPGVMNEVLINRQMRGEIPLILPMVDGYIAVLDCEDIGQTWWLRPYGLSRWESFLVIDCADPTLYTGDILTTEWMEKYNILAEVDYPTAKRWDTIGSWVHIERRIRNEQAVYRGARSTRPFANRVVRGDEGLYRGR